MIVRYRDQWSMWPAEGWTWTESTSIQIGCRKDAQELIEGMIQPWKVASSQYLKASLPCLKGKIGIVKERERGKQEI